MIFTILLLASQALDIAAANPAQQLKVTLYYAPEYIFSDNFEDQPTLPLPEPLP